MIQNILSVTAAFLGALSFTILYNTRGWRILIPAIGGAAFWSLHLLFLHFYNNEYLGFFLMAILITIYAEVWARILKTPATTVLIPTCIPFIPGGALYYTINAALRMDMATFTDKARLALGLAAALAAGIMLVTSLRTPFFSLLKKYKH
ncbi:MAG: threonine/serine exporter family protein [Clostridium sp.]